MCDAAYQDALRLANIRILQQEHRIKEYPIPAHEFLRQQKVVMQNDRLKYLDRMNKRFAAGFGLECDDRGTNPATHYLRD
jgi:hypothetical protein